MIDALYAKFSQNKQFKSQLLSTDGTWLISIIKINFYI